MTKTRRKHFASLLMSILILILLVINFNSCKPNNKLEDKKIDKKWTGSWLCMNVFDSLNYNDTNNRNRIAPTNVLANGISEIIINKELQDSILLINEGVELSFQKLKYISTDTLITGNNSLLVFNNEKKHFEYINKNNEKTTYFKATQNMLTPIVGYEKLKINSGFRKKYNTEFHRYSYILVDSLNDRSEKKYVTFFADGKVKGYKKFTTYVIHLNGDLNNIKDAMSISIGNSNGDEQFGLINYSDSIELFNISLLTKEYEKPYYKLSNKVATFIKQKWY
jgi:hypothetical protein